MSSAVNTLLQYFLIISAAYLYTKMPWNKKNSSSTMGGTLGKLHASGLADYYAGEKKRSQLAKKNHPESAVEQTNQKGRTVVDSNSHKDGATKEATLRESTRVKDRSQQQQQRRQGSADSTASQKKQTKQSSSGSPPPLAKQKSSSAAKAEKAGTIKRLQPDIASSTSKNQTVEDPLPIPAEEAAKHRRFLSEMFKDVPASEIDRVIRSVHWDVDEAATLLTQEDYTWQSVRRRRSIPGLEVAL